MKVKKSDFVRICSVGEMLVGEFGLLVGGPYSGTLVIKPPDGIGFNSLPTHIIEVGGGGNTWSGPCPPFTVGVLPKLPVFEIEYD